MKNNSLVNITDNALNRAKELLSQSKNVVGLRVSVSQGGCSGMTYEVSLSEKIKEGDGRFLVLSGRGEGQPKDDVSS